jgi:hypothetical protein
MQTPSAKSNQEQAVNVLAMRIEPLNKKWTSYWTQYKASANKDRAC